MPVQDGGSGTGDAFLTNLESQNNSTSLNSPSNAPATAKSINWKSIAWSDGAGAAGTLLRTWYMAGFGPLSWGAILSAIGFGAAWASGAALLYQLM
jgi:hypothetical protein